MKRLLATLLVLALGLTGCGRSSVLDTPEAKAVRSAVDTTRSHPRAFVMELKQEGKTFRVRGVVADDQRYRIQVSIDGVPALDEVAVDDAVAVRTLTQAGLSSMLCPVLLRGEAPFSKTLTASFNALVAHRWVLDRDGAPNQLPKVIAGKKLGDDPVVDALTAFDYLESAVTQSIGSTANPGRGFAKFDEQAFDYNPKTDPLPVPKDGSVRYDLLRRRLPRKADVQASKKNDNLITDANLRRLAIYVKDGRVRELRDTIDMRLYVKEINDIFDVRTPKQLTEDDAAALSLRGLNYFLRKNGSPLITQHALAIRFSELTPEESRISLPQDAVSGQLDLLKDHGRSAYLSQSDDTCRGTIESQEAADRLDARSGSNG